MSLFQDSSSNDFVAFSGSETFMLEFFITLSAFSTVEVSRDIHLFLYVMSRLVKAIVMNCRDLGNSLMVPRIRVVHITSTRESAGMSFDTSRVFSSTPKPDTEFIINGGHSDISDSVPWEMVRWVEAPVSIFGITNSDVKSGFTSIEPNSRDFVIPSTAVFISGGSKV